MTRQISIPTKQQVDDTVQYIIEDFKNTDIVDIDAIHEKEWYDQEKSLIVNWDVFPKHVMRYNKITYTMRDIIEIKKQYNCDENTIICFPRHHKFTNSKDEEETGVYYNAYPMYNLEERWNDVREYVPKELPPLYELVKFNNINLVYGPEKASRSGNYSTIANKQGVQDLIRLGSDDSILYFHELAHCYDNKLHTIRLNGSHLTEEIIADVVQCTLSMIYGKDTIQLSMSHLAKYKRVKDPAKINKDCKRLLKRITNVLHSIVDDANTIASQIE